MRSSLNSFLALILMTSFAFSQNLERDIRTQTNSALKEWLKNPVLSADTVPVELSVFFKDSGDFQNNTKSGNWVEYDLDSTRAERVYSAVIGDTIIQLPPSSAILKKAGIYVNGLRHGTWTTYRSFRKKPPFSWERKTMTTYNEGEKHGEEIEFQGYGEFQKPLFINRWMNGEPHGLHQHYDLNYPHNLLLEYLVDGAAILKRSKYQPNGKPLYLYRDTVIDEKVLIHFRIFWENGNLQQSGFWTAESEVKIGAWKEHYENGHLKEEQTYLEGERNGSYRFYHENGKIWTEREYEGGKLLNVRFNFDKAGNELDPGTLTNGTGTLNYYNADGERTRTVLFENGKEK